MGPSASITTEQLRRPSALDALAEDYLDARVALSPILGTALGVPGGEDRLDDTGIEGLRATHDLASRTLGRLDAVLAQDPTGLDAVDAVTEAALRAELAVTRDAAQRVLEGADPVELNVLDCPVQSVRDVFDLMATDTPQQWSWVLSRLQGVPRALEQYTEALSFSAGRGAVVARRQVVSSAAQCQDQADSRTSTYTELVSRARQAGVAEGLLAALEAAATAANAAFARLARWLTTELLPQAPDRDAVGAERYALRARAFLGADIDLEETYAWGQRELARITSLMERTAEQIRPGASVKEAVAVLDADERYRLHGTEALRSWMQATADEAVASLAGTHFDIPEEIRTIECMIAPSHTGLIYYTRPSEDFSRPGRMWWSVPEGETTFSTWRELTTVYHEGVPGHHLQLGQTTVRSETLNRWRRRASWTSGHGEGWALYAEWLMADLGYLDDPGMRMGLLDAQSLRAARVVLDIGVHCELEAPAEVGGGAWTYDKAWEFLNNHVNMAEGFVRFELDRYLGYPGQAPSYKIGERLWLELREEVRRREGDSFDIAAFHRRALDIGGVGLDVLRTAVLEQT
jgi:uncharacterized protein (DUF885 family)